MKSIFKGILSLIWIYLLIWIPTYIFVCVWGWYFKPWMILWIMNGFAVVKTTIHFSGESIIMVYLAPFIYILLSFITSICVYIYHPDVFKNFMIFMGFSLFGAIFASITYSK